VTEEALRSLLELHWRNRRQIEGRSYLLKVLSVGRGEEKKGSAGPKVKKRGDYW